MSNFAVFLLSMSLIIAASTLGWKIENAAKAYSCGSNPYLLYCEPYTDTAYFRERISYE